MKGQNISSTIKLLLAGIAIGIAGTILFGMVLCYIEGEELSTDPKTFGDIKVWAYKPLDVEGTVAQDVDKVLIMARNDIPFLCASQRNKAGKVTNLSLLDEEGRVCFTMTASAEAGKWERVIYNGYIDDNYTRTEGFVDINFDGHFDVKNVFDDTGKKLLRYIYVGLTWKEVDRCNFVKAESGQTMYVFDKDSGWRISQ